MNSLGERLKYARQRKGLTQAGLAAQSGASQQSVNMAEQGKARRPRSLHEMARILDVSVDWLLTGREGGLFTASNALVSGVAEGGGAIAQTHMQEGGRLPVLSLQATAHAGIYRKSPGVADYVARPPQLSGLDAAFALPVLDDSFAPRYMGGDMLLVHPGRTPVVGDNAVIFFTPEAAQQGDLTIAMVTHSDDRRLSVSPIGRDGGQRFDIYRSRIQKTGKIIGLYHK